MEYGWSMMEYRVRTYDLCKPSPMDLFSYFFSYLILFLAFPRGLLGWSSPSMHVLEPVPGVSICSDHCRTMCVILLVVVILHNSCFTQPGANCLDQVHFNLLE